MRLTAVESCKLTSVVMWFSLVVLLTHHDKVHAGSQLTQFGSAISRKGNIKRPLDLKSLPWHVRFGSFPISGIYGMYRRNSTNGAYVAQTEQIKGRSATARIGDVLERENIATRDTEETKGSSRDDSKISYTAHTSALRSLKRGYDDDAGYGYDHYGYGESGYGGTGYGFDDGYGYWYGEDAYEDGYGGGGYGNHGRGGYGGGNGGGGGGGYGEGDGHGVGGYGGGGGHGGGGYGGGGGHGGGGYGGGGGHGGGGYGGAYGGHSTPCKCKNLNIIGSVAGFSALATLVTLITQQQTSKKKRDVQSLYTRDIVKELDAVIHEIYTSQNWTDTDWRNFPENATVFLRKPRATIGVSTGYGNPKCKCTLGILGSIAGFTSLTSLLGFSLASAATASPQTAVLRDASEDATQNQTQTIVLTQIGNEDDINNPEGGLSDALPLPSLADLPPLATDQSNVSLKAETLKIKDTGVGEESDQAIRFGALIDNLLFPPSEHSMDVKTSTSFSRQHQQVP